jgi:hypothetical protein
MMNMGGSGRPPSPPTERSRRSRLHSECADTPASHTNVARLGGYGGPFRGPPIFNLNVWGAISWPSHLYGKRW